MWKLNRIFRANKRKVNFGDVADEWLEHKRGAIKESTYYEYMKIIEKSLKPKFGNRKIESITSINEYVQELNEKFEANTIKGIISVFKAIISYYEDEYNCKVKIKKINLPRSCKSNVEVFTKREISKLERLYIEENDTRLLGVIIALNTGLRIGEVCGLQWKNVDLVEKQIYINKTVERIHDNKTKKSKVIVTTPKTENSIRRIPMSSKLYKILKPIKPHNRGNCYVISKSEKAMEPRTYQNVFKKVLKENKIKIRKFHCLRHTFATNCIEVGMDIKSLSEILGHSNVNITLSTYVHSSDKIKKKYLEKL